MENHWCCRCNSECRKKNQVKSLAFWLLTPYMPSYSWPHAGTSSMPGSEEVGEVGWVAYRVLTQSSSSTSGILNWTSRSKPGLNQKSKSDRLQVLCVCVCAAGGVEELSWQMCTSTCSNICLWIKPHNCANESTSFPLSLHCLWKSVKKQLDRIAIHFSCQHVLK